MIIDFFDKIRSWRNALLYPLVVIFFWIIYGLLLANVGFDTSTYSTFKVLDKNSALSYLAVIVAIQIPIFILFLDKMRQSGDYKRLVLPYVTEFKETLLLLITCSTLALISPRESFLYFAIFSSLVVNIYAIVSALNVTFHQEYYDIKIRAFLKKAVRQTFKILVTKRISHREFDKDLEQIPYLDQTYFSVSLPNNLKSIKVKSTNNGRVEAINLNSIKKVYEQYYSIVNNTKGKVGDEIDNIRPKIYIHSRLGSRINAGDKLFEIHAPKDDKQARYLSRKLASTISISQISKSQLILFDELINSFESSINSSVKSNDTKELEKVLSDLQVLIDHFDETASFEEDKNYTIQDAFNELHWFNEDDLGKRIRRIYELFEFALETSVKEEKTDIAILLIRHAYKNIHSHTQRKTLTAIARWDRFIDYAIGLYVYKDDFNDKTSKYHDSIRNYILRQLKDHTETLMYELESSTDEEPIYNKKINLMSWVDYRISNIRSLILASYKNKEASTFSSLLSLLSDSELSGYHSRKDQELITILRSNLFMIAAYIFNRNDLESPAWKSVKSILMIWDHEVLMQILLHCLKEDYAHGWNIETYDHPADGVVREVPNYEDVFRKLWVYIALEMGAIPTDPRAFGEIEKFENSLFFTNSRSDNTDNPLLSEIAQSSSPSKADLETLVLNIIKIRHDWEANKLAKAPLDTSKVGKFTSLINESYEESSIILKYFNNDKHYKVETSSKQKEYKRIGIHQIFDKEAFIDDWHSGYYIDGFASQLGSNIAQTQDKNVFEQLLTDRVSMQSKDEFLNQIKQFKQRKLYVLSNNVGDWEVRREFQQHIRKSEKYGDIKLSGIKQIGYMQTIFSDKLPDGIFVFPASNIGVITRKPHKQPNNTIEVLIDPYTSNRKLSKELTDNPPNWLKAKGTTKEQESFLSQKVRLVVDYVYRYQRPVKSEALHFKIKD